MNIRRRICLGIALILILLGINSLAHILGKHFGIRSDNMGTFGLLIAIAFAVIWFNVKEKGKKEAQRSSLEQKLQPINRTISQLEQDLKQDEELEDVTGDAVARMVKDGVITNEEADRIIASIRSHTAKKEVYPALIRELEKEKVSAITQHNDRNREDKPWLL